MKKILEREDRYISKKYFVKIKDCIIHELSEHERANVPHYSEFRNYMPYWSVPYRVTKVKKETVPAVKIFYKSNEAQVPIANIKTVCKDTNLEFQKAQLEHVVKMNKAKLKFRRSGRQLKPTKFTSYEDN